MLLVNMATTAATAHSEISNLIDCLRERWSTTSGRENNEVIKAAMGTLAKLDTTHIINLTSNRGSSASPPMAAVAVERPIFAFETNNNRLLEAAGKLWPLLNNWIEVCQGVKMAYFCSANNVICRFLYVDKNATFGQHSYDESTEVLHILSADEDTALMGQCEQWMSAIKTDTSHYFCKTAPKMIKAGNKAPLLALSMLNGEGCSSGLSSASIKWPDEKCGRLYGSNLMDVQGTGAESVAQYYDNFADDYDKAVHAWGYCLPETSVEAAFKYGDLQHDVQILDLCCGNGLVGEALCKRSTFSQIMGLDISQKSLDAAANRRCYTGLQKADLLQKLPFDQGSFDYLFCIGATSYLEPFVLEDWLDVVKPKGKLCFSVKTSLLPKWEEEQGKLEKLKKWKEIWSHPGIPYLPNLRPDGSNSCKELVKLWIYQKL